MKSLLALSLLATFAVQAAPKAQINCQGKNGSILSIDNKQVTIGISHISGSTEYAQKLARAFNVHIGEGQNVDYLKLVMPAKRFKCTQEGLIVACHAEKKMDAWMEVNVSKKDMFNNFSMMSGRTTKIGSVHILSFITNSGDVNVGSEPTTVTLDQVGVNAEVTVLTSEGPITLALEPRISSSDCK